VKPGPSGPGPGARLQKLLTALQIFSRYPRDELFRFDLQLWLGRRHLCPGRRGGCLGCRARTGSTLVGLLCANQPEDADRSGQNYRRAGQDQCLEALILSIGTPWSQSRIVEFVPGYAASRARGSSSPCRRRERALERLPVAQGFGLPHNEDDAKLRDDLSSRTPRLEWRPPGELRRKHPGGTYWRKKDRGA
jgi:hypothetical protein